MSVGKRAIAKTAGANQDAMRVLHLGLMCPPTRLCHVQWVWPPPVARSGR